MTARANAVFALAGAAALACNALPGDGGGAAVTVQPQTAALCVGDSLTFSAQVLDASGHVVAGQPVRWSSSAPATVAVDSVSGVAHALALGTAQITAAAGGLRSAKPGRLDVPSDLSPELVPDTVVLAPGDTFTFGARLRRLSAGPVPGRTPLIAPFDTSVARLDATGLVTAKAPGMVTFVVSACGFTGLGTAQVYTPPDSLTGTGYLWLSGPVEMRVRLGTVVHNFSLTSKKPAFQVTGRAAGGAKQFAYEDTLRLAAAGTFPLDSLTTSEATSAATCSPPRPFALYGDNANVTVLLSLRGGSASVTSFTPQTGYTAVSGRAVTRVRGYVNGVLTTLDTLQAIYTFSAPLRDSTGVCP